MAKERDIVAEAKQRFERAKSAYDASRALAIADTKFAMGDSDNGWQWPDDIRNSRKTDKKVCLTVNVTAQHCNQIINEIRQNRPAIKVSPVDSGADKKSAEIIGGLIRNILAQSCADEAHDLAAEHSVYGGEGYWRIVTEYESETSFDQVIRIKAIPNPQLVYIDVDAIEPDKSDAKWGFVFEDVPNETFKAEYPKIDPASWGAEAKKSGWAEDDTVRIAEYFWCDSVSDVACLLGDGSTALKSALPAGVKVLKERPTQVKRWQWCKLVGGHDEPVDLQDWAGSLLPIIGVVGKELNIDGEVIRKGLVRDIKDPARMVNYAYSETVQNLALQNRVPYLAAAEAIEGYESIWGAANAETRAYLPFNAFDDEGKAIPRPERQAPPQMASAQVQLLQLSVEQMRAASGQHNSNFGIKSEAQSGVGIQRLKAQGEIATFHFPDNLSRALRYEGRVLIDLIQKYYDTKRVVRILGLDGSEEMAILDPQMQQPYAENKLGVKDVEKIFNPLLGRYDVAVDTGPSYQTQRQEAFSAMTEMASRNPQLLQAAGDIIMRAADFPFADKLADRLEKTIPPELRDEQQEQGEIPPQAQQAMQQAMQHIQQQDGMIQQLQQALEQAQKAVEGKEVELRKAIVDAEAEVEVARINKEKDEDIAELNAYIELMKAKMQPPPALAADVEQDLSEPEPVEEPPLPKLLRRRIQIQAPSGAIYSGMIEDDESPVIPQEPQGIPAEPGMM